MTHPGHLKGVWPTGCPLPPVDPAKLTGPDVGTIVRYHSQTQPPYRMDGQLMRVKERSYVWSPGECRSNGGYRHYDWTVVEWPVLSRTGAIVWDSMVVDDDKLTVVT